MFGVHLCLCVCESSVLQCVAAFCSALHIGLYVVVRCSVLQCCSVLYCVAYRPVCCSALQRVAVVCCSVLRIGMFVSDTSE